MAAYQLHGTSDPAGAASPLKASDAFVSMFDVVIQLGAILAVIVLFFHKLNPFSGKKSDKEKKQTWNLWFKVIVAVLPSVVLGLLLDDWLDAHLYNHIVVAITLILYGVAFIVVEQYNRKRRRQFVPPARSPIKLRCWWAAFRCWQ